MPDFIYMHSVIDKYTLSFTYEVSSRSTTQALDYYYYYYYYLFIYLFIDRLIALEICGTDY